MDDYMKYLGDGRTDTCACGGAHIEGNPDMVNHPPHYTNGGVECVDAIESALSAQSDTVSAWLTGQVIKYLWRFPQKNGVEDLEKAQWYLARLIKREKEAAT